MVEPRQPCENEREKKLCTSSYHRLKLKVKIYTAFLFTKVRKNIELSAKIYSPSFVPHPSKHGCSIFQKSYFNINLWGMRKVFRRWRHWSKLQLHRTQKGLCIEKTNSNKHIKATLSTFYFHKERKEILLFSSLFKAKDK